jgi:hypothetical protein
MIRNFSIGVTIIFFALSGIITFKALGLHVSKIYYQTTPKELDQKEHLPNSENNLRKSVKEQAGRRASDKKFQSPNVKLEYKLSNKNKETHHKDNKNIIQVRSDKNIDTKNKLKRKYDGYNQYTSGLVYTVQIASQKSIADAQNQFNSILRSHSEINLNLLRIEKVGKYYTVRIGKFDNYDSGNKFLEEIKPGISEAIILKAYIKNERIVKKYNVDVSEEKKENNINGNSFEVITEHNVVLPSMPSIKKELQKSLSLPPNEKPLLLGTVINSDKKFAIIENQATKQSGLYKINDRVMGFIVSDIFEDKVILQKNDGFIEIGLRDNKAVQSQRADRKIQEQKRMSNLQKKRNAARRKRISNIQRKIDAARQTGRVQ